MESWCTSATVSEVTIDPEAKARYLAMFPMVPTRASITCRAIRERQVIHVPDLQGDPELDSVVKALGMRAQLSVPLLREGSPIGVITLVNSTGPFTDSQVALLQTFAEQAVIAIGSAETYRELQARTAALAQRNSEYGERIEQQSATIDVLKAMSDSPDDTQPVFDLITRRAAELCKSRAGLWEFDGTLLHFRAGYGTAPEATAAFARQFPRPAGHVAPWPGGRYWSGASSICRTWPPTPTYRRWPRDLGGSAIVAMPLLRDEQPIGAIALNGSQPGGFSDSQIALLQTFAEQAVIAIGSVANFRALRERTAELTRSVAELQALEEVLRAVNSSLDLDTVLATIISRAVQLSQADEGTIYEFDEAEQVFVPKAAFGMTEERVAALARAAHPAGRNPSRPQRGAACAGACRRRAAGPDARRRRRRAAGHPRRARRAAAARGQGRRRPGDPPAHRRAASRRPSSR